MTESEYLALEQRMREAGAVSVGSAELAGSPPYVKPKAAKIEKPTPIEGPLSVLLTLYGHCPSKKNLWQRGTAGKMFLDADTRKQIDTLTLQAQFGWKFGGPVEHPELTIQFFVCGAKRDRDGMLVTVLDCLQSAGVIVNDNLAHCNSRLILEPAVFVSEADERVEILVETK